MNKCETCGGLHYRLDPCRVPKKSNGPSSLRFQSFSNLGGSATTSAGTVVDKDRQLNTDQKQYASDSLGSGPTIASAKAPVTKQLSKASLGNTDGSDPLKQTRPAKFDKTAYMKTYMVKWRKRQKEKRGGQRS